MIDASNTQCAKLNVHDYPGKEGDRTHITRVETGTIETAKITHLQGASGEKRGEHRNKTGKDWIDFKRSVFEEGIKEPIFITQDYGEEAVVSEGNHRLDAALELGLVQVPVEIRYFGHAEKDHKK